MKNYLTPLLLLLVACSSVPQEPKELNLIGKWDVVDFACDITDLPESIFQEVKQSVMETDYQFNADGTFIKSMKTENTIYEGTWKYNEKFRILRTNYEFGATEITVKSFSETEMEWYDDLDGGPGNRIIYLEKY